MSTLSTQYFQRVLISSSSAVVPSQLASAQTSNPDAVASNFMIQVPEAMEGKYKVKYITIPNTIYNVNTSNNALNWTAGGPYYDAVLPVGNYDGATLATAVAAALTAGDLTARTYTATFDAITSKLTITNSTADDMIWAAGQSANTVIGVYNYNGFGSGGLVNITASGSALPYPIFLGAPLSLGIRIKQAADAGYVTGINEIVTKTTVPVTTDYSTIPPTVNTGAPVSTTDVKCVPVAGTLIVPLLAASNTFNYTTQDEFEQFFKLEKGTKLLQIQVVDTATGTQVDLNRGQLEMLVERVEPDLSIPKLKRQRIYRGQTRSEDYR